MRHQRQIEFLERVANAGPHLEGLHGESSMINSASAYTDPDRFAVEQRVLFRDGPVFFAMSVDLPDPGCYRATTFDGIPLVVVRQADGSLRAVVNACRHRGAALVETHSQGTGLLVFSCPYHSWTYDTAGSLTARPMSAGAFDDVTLNCDLHQRAVAEKHGMIFVRPGGTEPIDVDQFLSGAEDDLGAFDLGSYTFIDSRTNEWDFNWKLIFDTFTESYHIRTLHKQTLAPTFDSDGVIFEPFGRNLVSIGLRKSVREEVAKPRDEWSLLPYGTIQYFLVPNGLVVHQVDHVEVWTVEPLGVGRVRTTTAMYAPTPPVSDKAHNYFMKNLDLLEQVTGTEDFPVMERIYANLASGALPELVYGRLEQPLIHFHTQINHAYAAATA